MNLGHCENSVILEVLMPVVSDGLVMEYMCASQS